MCSAVCSPPVFRGQTISKAPCRWQGRSWGIFRSRSGSAAAEWGRSSARPTCGSTGWWPSRSSPRAVSRSRVGPAVPERGPRGGQTRPRQHRPGLLHRRRPGPALHRLRVHHRDKRPRAPPRGPGSCRSRRQSATSSRSPKPCGRPRPPGSSTGTSTPSNIIIEPTGRATLVDLGLARQASQAGEELTVAGTTLGTFDYISPEQAVDPRQVDVRSDIYSLGCTRLSHGDRRAAVSQQLDVPEDRRPSRLGGPRSVAEEPRRPRPALGDHPQDDGQRTRTSGTRRRKR